jgi:SAM-dependent methyltransferase
MTTEVFKTRTTCRLCNGLLMDVLSLGDIYLNNFVTDDTVPVTAPLTLSKCTTCSLVQLRDTANLDLLYRQYWYQSGLNKSMVEALQDVVNDVEARIQLQSGDTVIDIGCNDGTLLSLYHTDGLVKVGYDPALNLAEKAVQKCTVFYNTYFGSQKDEPAPEYAKAKVITSIAMFYDLEDPHTFVEACRQVLAPDGIWVIQMTDLLSMLRLTAFDNICAEHLEYYSLSVVDQLLRDHGLQIFDVAHNKVNGGSLRLFVCFKDASFPCRGSSVEKALADEREYFKGLEDQGKDPFQEFALRVAEIRKQVQTVLAVLQRQRKSVYVLGASTKGNTLLQYFNITNKQIPFAAEVNKDKFGRRTVGTNILICSEQELMANKPACFLVLPWHFIDMLCEVHKQYLLDGGLFLVPMPEPGIYSGNGDTITFMRLSDV